MKTLNAEIMPNWQENEAFLQVALLTAITGFVSFADSNCRFVLRRALSAFRRGHVPIQTDSRPPSRAYLKLLEAEKQFGFEISKGANCVDLAASPGGWTWVALQRGANVIAIDRAPLRADLMKHPKLTFQKGDAFKYQPAETVDWLLCDIIAFPEKTIGLLDTWLTKRLCRRFCVTIKFRGEENDQLLEDLKRMLERRATEFFIRKLANNKNEVTAAGML